MADIINFQTEDAVSSTPSRDNTGVVYCDSSSGSPVLYIKMPDGSTKALTGANAGGSKVQLAFAVSDGNSATGVVDVRPVQVDADGTVKWAGPTISGVKFAVTMPEETT